MKKISCVLLSGILCLTACSTNLLSAPSSKGAQSTGDNKPIYDLQLTTKIDGATDVIASKDGAYFASLPTMNTISFLDEKSGVVTPLCNRLECTHNDESCAAYVDTSIYYLFMNANKSKLFLSYSDGVIYDTEYPVQHIFSMDLNGANRKEIFRIENGDLYWDYVFSKNTMFFLTNTIDKDSRNSRFNLISLNYETGEYSTLDSFAQNAKIIGAFDNYILFDFNNDSIGSAVADIVQYNVVTKEQSTLFHYETNGYTNANRIAFANKENLYIIEPSGEEMANLTRIDMRTGETTAISDEITYFGPHCSFYNPCYFSDGYMFLRSSVPPLKGERFPRSVLNAINLQDGTQKSIELRGPSNQPFLLLGSMQDNYILYTRIEERIIKIANSGGTKTDMNLGISVFSSIPKDDFLNSINNISDFR